jgi:hypothetical protein
MTNATNPSPSEREIAADGRRRRRDLAEHDAIHRSSAISDRWRYTVFGLAQARGVRGAP